MAMTGEFMAAVNVRGIGPHYNASNPGGHPRLTMTLRTLARYLFTGSPDAIRTIAASRGAVWAGLAFVLSAGLAREYDGEYLVARPWVLAVPFAAAVGLATLLFVPIYVGTRGL